MALALDRPMREPCFRASSEVIFHLGADHTIALGVAHTEQGITFFDLLIIQKRLIGLIHSAREHQPRTGATGPRPAGIGQINTLLLRCVEDVGVLPTRKGCATFDRDGVVELVKPGRVHADQAPRSQTVTPNTAWGDPHESTGKTGQGTSCGPAIRATDAGPGDGPGGGNVRSNSARPPRRPSTFCATETVARTPDTSWWGDQRDEAWSER